MINNVISTICEAKVGVRRSDLVKRNIFPSLNTYLYCVNGIVIGYRLLVYWTQPVTNNQ